MNFYGWLRLAGLIMIGVAVGRHLGVLDGITASLVMVAFLPIAWMQR